MIAEGVAIILRFIWILRGHGGRIQRIHPEHIGGKEGSDSGDTSLVYSPTLEGKDAVGQG